MTPPPMASSTIVRVHLRWLGTMFRAATMRQDLGFGRIVASDTEVPNTFANLV